jgi:hypothetical protein
VIWGVALAQVAFVLFRYGLGDVLRIEMGGAAQAKAFFPAIGAYALLFAGGIGQVGSIARVPQRCLVLGVFGWLLALDAASLAVTTWHHYRWLQLGG